MSDDKLMESDDKLTGVNALVSSGDGSADIEAAAAIQSPPEQVPPHHEGASEMGRQALCLDMHEGLWGFFGWAISIAVLGTAGAILAHGAIPLVRPFAIYAIICVGAISGPVHWRIS